jgi:hypothetical protein
VVGKDGGFLPKAATQRRTDYIVVNSASDHLPCDASIVLKVDDRERRWNVHLPNGIAAGAKRVALSAPRAQAG